MNFHQNMKYFLGRFLTGETSGINSPEKARDTILADINRAKEDFKVVSCTADMVYWSNEVVDALEKRLDKYPSMGVEFLVGPDLNNPRLEALSRDGKIALIQLKENPPCDCRIINLRDTYTSNHGGQGRPRRYLWTFKNLPAFRDRRDYYLRLKESIA